jgi:hypothetical protein
LRPREPQLALAYSGPKVMPELELVKIIDRLAKEVLKDDFFIVSLRQITKYVSADESSRVQELITQDFLEGLPAVLNESVALGISIELQQKKEDLQNAKNNAMRSYSETEEGANALSLLTELEQEISENKAKLINLGREAAQKKVELASMSNGPRRPEERKKKQLQREISTYQTSLPLLSQSIVSMLAIHKRYKEQQNERAYWASPQIARLDKEVTEVEVSLEAKLRSILRERLTLLLNKYIQQFYSPSIDFVPPWLNAWGISEVFLSNYEITTVHHKKLSNLLENMPGGSIGISGPRGSGKTTLIWSFCSSNSMGRIHNRALRSIMTSAPVRYDAREFALHIFASACNLVLNSTSEGGSSAIEREITTNAPASIADNDNARRLIASRAVRFARLAGPLLLSASLSLAGFFVFKSPTFNNDLDQGSGPRTLQLKSVTQKTKEETLVQKTTRIAIYGYIDELGITPSSLFYWGLILTSLGIVTSPPNRPKRVIRGQAIINNDSQHDAENSSGKLTNSDSFSLRRYALRCLDAIQFQYSYTSGSTGSIKLPALLESSSNQSSTLQRIRATFPEIVNEYKQFVKRAISILDIVLVIGIDELDKLDTGNVQLFLNDIKALFGIENCYYLISVSEDAMSSFELRGIPFRDVFDSTFDTILHVDYLSFDEARNLIDKRVIGLPKILFAFIYCMAGGLPRELIRYCRNVLDGIGSCNLAGTEDASALDLMRHEISRDIHSKIKSIYIQGKSIFTDSSADDFLYILLRIEKDLGHNISVEALMEACRSLNATKKILSSQDQDKHGLAKLEAELQAYLFYMVTMLEVFTTSHSSGLMEESEESNVTISCLAKARQFFAVSPSFGFLLVSEFRSNRQLSSI